MHHTEAINQPFSIPNNRSRWLLSQWIPLFSVLVAVVLWLISLRSLNPDQFNSYGVISTLSPLYYAAFVVLTVSFCWLVFQKSTSPLLLLVYIVVLVFFVHATLPLVYQEPRFAWVYKHLGVIEYLRRTGILDPSFDIYNNWPGFFGAAALIDRISGADQLFFLARWGQVIFNLLDCCALYLAFSALTNNKRTVWLGIWFFELANWVGADYLSPQAFGYFFHLIILALFIAYFCLDRQPHFDWLARWNPAKTAARWLNRLAEMAQIDRQRFGSTTFITRLIIAALILAMFFVIDSSHQLTPFMTLIAVAGLILTWQARGRYLPVIMLIMIYLWLNGPASVYMTSQASQITSQIGQVTDNINQRLDSTQDACCGRMLVSWSARIMTASVWGMAILGILWLLRKGELNIVPIVLAFSPIPMIASQSYGGEMLFRIYLFSLPWMLFLAVRAFTPRQEDAAPWWAIWGTIAASLVLFSMLLFAYFGNEQMDNFTANEVNARNYLYQVAPPGSLVLKVNYNAPDKYNLYEQYLDVDMSLIDNLKDKHLTSNDIPTIVNVMKDPGYLAWLIPKNQYFTSSTAYPGAYLLISRSQELYAQLMEPGAKLDDIAVAVAHSPDFELIYQNSDVQIYTLAHTEEF